LPALSSSLVVPVPIDDPALHQGRVRTTPHVEGQFPAYIYVSLTLERRSPLYNFLVTVFETAKEIVPTLHQLWSPGDNGKLSQGSELHISLSRSIYLRAHQREDLKRAVKDIAKRHRPFTVSFAAFSQLINDERTRIFLAMEVGAGHSQLKELSDALIPALQAIRQMEYYHDPRYHASIAWDLLPCPSIQSILSSAAATTVPEANVLPHSSLNTVSDPMNPIQPITISGFPETLVPTLNEQYGGNLVSTRVGAFDVEDIRMKVGKEVYRWRLTGA